MKEITCFRSEHDGTIFETKQECFEYDQSHFLDEIEAELKKTLGVKIDKIVDENPNDYFNEMHLVSFLMDNKDIITEYYNKVEEKSKMKISKSSIE